MWVAAAQRTPVPYIHSQALICKEWDLSPESNTTFNNFSLATSLWVLYVQRKEKGWIDIHVPYWRWQRVWAYILSQRNLISGENKERRGSVLFLRGDDFCSAAENGRNIKLEPIFWLRNLKENSHLSKPCQVWSYAMICIIPKGHRSFPDWRKVTWTSFPSGLAPIHHTELSAAFSGPHQPE